MNSGGVSDQVEASGSAAAALPPDFPKGLRVLLVEDDDACVAIIKKMLQKCMYNVSTCDKPKLAMAILQNRKEKIDLVLSSFYMHDKRGFKLLESIEMEMNIPVIMMSSDQGQDAVLKGVMHGACDYLIKPLRMESLKNIWQHVVRKSKNEWKECQQQQEDSQRNQIRLPEDGYEVSSSSREGVSNGCAERKKDVCQVDVEVRADSQQQAPKKRRVVWGDDLHEKFLGAVNQLGVKNVVPKKILELMEETSLTRANVASHLQKYRLNLKKEQQRQQQIASAQQQIASAGRSNFQNVHNCREIILAQKTAAIGSRRRMRMNNLVEKSAIHEIGRNAQAAFPPTVGSASMQQMNNIPMNQLIGGSDNTNLRDYGGSYSVVQSYGSASGYFSPLPSQSLATPIGEEHNRSLLMLMAQQGNLLSMYNQEQGMHVNLPRPPNPWQEQLVPSTGSHEPIVPTTSTHQGPVNNILSSQVELCGYNASAPTTFNGCHADATFYHHESVPPLCSDVQNACTIGSSQSVDPMELCAVTTEPQFTVPEDSHGLTGLDDILNMVNQEQDEDGAIDFDDFDCDFDS